jgi:hypothetical protein
MTTSVLILQLAVLGVVLESDLGLRKVGWFRVLRPIIAVVLIVPFFFTSLPTSGNDLLLQGAGALTGLVLGLASMGPWFVQVGWHPAWRGRFHRGQPKGVVVSRAGLGYASVWIVVTAVRLWFAYAAQHEFPVQLGHFLAAHQLSATALTNAFIFLSIGMDLFRSVLLAARARRVRSGHHPLMPGVAATGRAAPAQPAAPAAAAPAPEPAGAAETTGTPGRASGLLSLPLQFMAGRLDQREDQRQDRWQERQDRRDRRGRRRL